MRISVALAYYRGEQYIREQLQSILPQLSLQDEVVISVDDITERGKNLLRSLQEGDDRIRTNEDIEKTGKLPLLGIIPLQETERENGDVPARKKRKTVRMMAKATARPWGTFQSVSFRTIGASMAERTQAKASGISTGWSVRATAKQAMRARMPRKSVCEPGSSQWRAGARSPFPASSGFAGGGVAFGPFPFSTLSFMHISIPHCADLC